MLRHQEGLDSSDEDGAEAGWARRRRPQRHPHRRDGGGGRLPGLQGTDGSVGMFPPVSWIPGLHHSSSVAEKLLGSEELMLLENLLPVVAKYNQGLIDHDRANIDGISLLAM